MFNLNLSRRERKIVTWCISLTLVFVLIVSAFIMVNVFGQPNLKRGSGATVFDIALNRISVLKNIQQFGAIPSVSNVTFECMWERGGVCPLPTTGSTLKIASGNINDDSGGSGARKINIEGCETSTWISISEDVITNGTSDSLSTVKSFIRINQVIVTGGGLYGGPNVGEMSIVQTSGGFEVAVVPADYGMTRQSFFSVCEDNQFIPRALTVTTGDTNQEVEVMGIVREGADIVIAPFTPSRPFFDVTVVGGQLHTVTLSSIAIPQRSDISLVAKSKGQTVGVKGLVEGTLAIGFSQ